jgi:hypothetical protein
MLGSTCTSTIMKPQEPMMYKTAERVSLPGVNNTTVPVTAAAE